MGLLTTDIREIKSAIVSTFNEKCLQEIIEKVTSAVERKIKEKLNSQNQQIKTLTNNTEELRKENDSPRKSMESQEQAGRSMNIRIREIDVQKDENIRSRVIRLFTNTLKINFQNSDIKKWHRVPFKNPGNKPPAVRIRCVYQCRKINRTYKTLVCL
ncbi:unnamed protein product [Acanthoscelides obtectus]|uniref:Uncharacterized protein n=1 Tax=Acanthoscelides obtectus TaxID=200917 RepID=A0A9P0QFR9_ACAOB|nr:unnamed protein product [Acanthoscelides obtectus]CAK1682726.1 hypothetical protein AOBTE_LOCUS33830 [Acanthoscelides obtectus]